MRRLRDAIELPSTCKDTTGFPGEAPFLPGPRPFAVDLGFLGAYVYDLGLRLSARLPGLLGSKFGWLPMAHDCSATLPKEPKASSMVKVSSLASHLHAVVLHEASRGTQHIRLVRPARAML